MKKIIDIHGQQDNQLLLDPKYHINYLDSFIGDKLKSKKNFIWSYIPNTKETRRITKNYGDEKEKERRLDLLRYQLNEIAQANLKSREDEELEEKRNIIVNSERLHINLTEIDETLSNQVIDGLSNSIKALEKIEEYGEIYKEKLIDLKNIYYEIQEHSRDFENMKTQICFDECERDDIEKDQILYILLKENMEIAQKKYQSIKKMQRNRYMKLKMLKNITKY